MKRICIIFAVCVPVFAFAQTCVPNGNCDIRRGNCPANYTCVTKFGVATTDTAGQCIKTVEVNTGMCIPASSMGFGGGRGVVGSGDGVSSAQSPADAMRLAMEAMENYYRGLTQSTSPSLSRSVSAPASACPSEWTLGACPNDRFKGYRYVDHWSSIPACQGNDINNKCWRGRPGATLAASEGQTVRGDYRDYAATCMSWACGTPPPPRRGGVFGPGRPVCAAGQFICANNRCSVGGVCYGSGGGGRRPNPNPNPNAKKCRLERTGNIGTIICD